MGALVRQPVSIKHPPFVDRTRKWRPQSMDLAVYVDEGFGRRTLSIKHPPFVDRTRKWRRQSMNQAVCVDEGFGRRTRRASGDDGGGLCSLRSLRPLPPLCGGPLPLHVSGGGHASSCHHLNPMNQPRQAATIHEIGSFYGKVPMHFYCGNSSSRIARSIRSILLSC